MATKNSPGTFDCYANALPDEPLFVLLARDPQAPALLRAWADGRELAIARGSRPASDEAMVHEAKLCADEMERWRKRNDGAWRNACTFPQVRGHCIKRAHPIDEACELA
jgi:hypothetical protein